MVTNATGATLVCLGPSSGFEVRPVLRRKPAAGEIEVAVAAASVNPIDVRRAQGYGRRLLSLVGAGRFPMVLGNDFAGMVTALGDNVDAFKIGDRVYGVKPPSAEGKAVQSRHMKVELVSAQRRRHSCQRHSRRAACSSEGRSLS
jgi:reticulon-4-interacting protein 1, mitochondrial